MMRMALLISAGYLLVAELPSSYCHHDKGSDNSYWSWRIIDGAKCWYRGRPGRPKTELRWAPIDDTPSSAAKQDGTGGVLITSPVSAATPAPEPELEPVSATPEPAPWRASDEDMLLALTCCWPELEPQPAPLSTAPLTPMTAPHELNWWWPAGLLVAYALYRLFGLNLIRGGLHGKRQIA